MKPAVLVYRRRCRNRHFVIAFHNIVASCHKLSRHAVRALFTRFGVNYFAFYLGQRSAYRRNADVYGVVCRGHRTARRCFRLTVDNGYLFHVHLFGHVFHNGDGTRAARHYARSHAGEIGLREVGVFKQGYKHRRNAVESGYFFLVDARKSGLRREIGKRKHRRTVRHGSRHRKHHAETVEHRNLYHHSVGGRKIHSVADTFAVVDYIVVRQHNAFGKARCA